MGVAPKHPLIFFTLHSAIYNLIVKVPNFSGTDTTATKSENINAAAAAADRFTGMAALALGIDNMLEQTKWFYKRRMKFEMGRPLLPGSYIGIQPKSQFRLLGGVSNGVGTSSGSDGRNYTGRYWVTRKLDPNVKRANYERMNMTDYYLDGKERSYLGSCMVAISQDFEDRLQQ
mmetsp:Transcript_16371/g.23783  ORF Transcript_16371/g.23783 Transcript_16371/m.23783 type:complete len:174 (+) Transcript_16371:1-522(+)